MRKNLDSSDDEKIESLNKNRTGVKEKQSFNKKGIPYKWIYKKNQKVDGSVDKFRARLVIKGYAQRKSENFIETFLC